MPTITPLTRPEPYRALALSTPSTTCLERRGGSVHAMACQTLSPAKSNGSLECLQEIQAMSEPMSKKERVASQTESRYL
jgi:hypothetical protein